MDKTELAVNPIPGEIFKKNCGNCCLPGCLNAKRADIAQAKGCMDLFQHGRSLKDSFRRKRVERIEFFDGARVINFYRAGLDQSYITLKQMIFKRAYQGFNKEPFWCCGKYVERYGWNHCANTID
ncbi:MAG TPA: hypothetical protein PLY85_07435 [Anaerolineaceae bacterium]|nr:hypothetical protein [Anaerolineaceae bacterium]